MEGFTHTSVCAKAYIQVDVFLDVNPHSPGHMLIKISKNVTTITNRPIMPVVGIGFSILK